MFVILRVRSCSLHEFGLLLILNLTEKLPTSRHVQRPGHNGLVVQCWCRLKVMVANSLTIMKEGHVCPETNSFVLKSQVGKHDYPKIVYAFSFDQKIVFLEK